MKGRPVDLSKQVQILKAASCHFLDHGYDKSSIEAIAEEAAVSKVTIYRHFVSKPELFKQAMALELRRIQADACFPQATGTTAERLFAFGMTLHELVSKPAFVRAERRIAADLHSCTQIGDVFFDATWRHFHSCLEELLVGLEREGCVSIDDTALAADQLLSLFCGMAHFERRFGQKEDRQHSIMRIAAGIDLFLVTYGCHRQAKTTKRPEAGRRARFQQSKCERTLQAVSRRESKAARNRC